MRGAFAGARRHEALRQILGFNATQELFMDSDAVQDSFDEFVRDFLTEQRSSVTLPNFETVMEGIGKAEIENAGLYTAEQPENDAWAPADHTARFNGQVQAKAKADNECVWPGLEEEDKAVWGWQLRSLSC
jgi:hypothetical protein